MDTNIITDSPLSHLDNISGKKNKIGMGTQFHQSKNIGNNKKLARKYQKQGKAYKEYPMLNLYILISAVFASILPSCGIDAFRIMEFIRIVPTMLMVVYMGSKISNRDHLVPKLIRAGLMLSVLAETMIVIKNYESSYLLSDQPNNLKLLDAYEIICALIYVAVVCIYMLAMNLGSKVRYRTLSTFFYQIISIVFILSVQLYVHYSQYQIFTTLNMPVIKNMQPMLFSFLSLFFAILLIICIMRYSITTPYSFSFCVTGSSCLLIASHCWIYSCLNQNNQHESSLIKIIAYFIYYSGQYILMHGTLHHSNLLFEIDSFIKNKQKQNIGSRGTIIEQQPVFKPNVYRQATSKEESDSDTQETVKMQSTRKQKIATNRNKNYRKRR